MRTLTQFLLFVLGFVLVCFLALSAHGSTNMYVATTGSDSNPGTISQPFATVGAAQTALRALAPIAGGATVYLRGGTYCATNPFALTYQDSGVSAASPIVWRNYPGELVDWIGGLPLTNWQTWQTNILAVNVSTQGFLSSTFRTLLFNGQRQRQARFPNYSAADPYGTNGSWRYMSNSTTTTSFQYTNGTLPNIANWANPALAHVFRFFSHNYGSRMEPITNINTTTQTISFSNSTAGMATSDRFYIENVFEELDTTNEFYINPTTSICYWFPPSIPGTAYGILSSNLVNVTGASNIWFVGMTLEGTANTLFTTTNCTNCAIAGCTIRNSGDFYGEEYAGYGVWLSGGYQNGCVSNNISSTAADGVLLDGGDSINLLGASNYCSWNVITTPGQMKKEVAGIRVRGCGNIAWHNLIFNSPRWGVCCVYGDGYSGHITCADIEYNHIHDCGMETDDQGPIYLYCPDWISARGSMVRYNYCHNCSSYGGGDQNPSPNSGQRLNGGTLVGNQGIYLDGLINGVDVVGNIVDKCDWGLLYFNGGRDCRAFNNVLLQTTNWEFRMTGFHTNSSSYQGIIAANTAGFNAVNGNLAWANVRGATVAPTTISANGIYSQNNIFATNLLSYTPYLNGNYVFVYVWNGTGSNYMIQNSLDYNCAWAGTNSISAWAELPLITLSWPTTWQATGEDAHSINADPQFRLSYPGDYYVTNATVLALGFQQIPAQNIGPTNLFGLGQLNLTVGQFNAATTVLR